MSCESARLICGSRHESWARRIFDGAEAGMNGFHDKISIGQSYGESDTGRKRRRNEDNLVCDPPLFAVADGMGGAQAGELPAGLAAEGRGGARAGDLAS